MKLVRYGPPGAEKPGLLDRDGVLRDLSAIVADISPALLGTDRLRQLASIAPARPPAQGVQPGRGGARLAYRRARRAHGESGAHRFA